MTQSSISLRHSLSIAILLAGGLLCAMPAALGQSDPANFSTVITLPTDLSPGTVSSDTQVNVLPTGVLASSRWQQLDLGADDGSSTNIEVNLLGGSAGSFLTVNNGATLNLIDGTIGDQMVVANGGILRAQGGYIDQNFRANNGSDVQIDGGSFGNSFQAAAGSEVVVTGGYFGEGFNFNSGSSVKFVGYDFRLNGELIAGLDTLGTSLPFNLPLGSALSGYFSDGSPFAFTYQSDTSRPGGETDVFMPGSLVLERATAPTAAPGTINLPADPTPLGLGSGQELVVATGGIVEKNFVAGWGSKVHLDGGTIRENFEAVGAEVLITDGIVSWYFDAFAGSNVTIQGGSIGRYFNALRGSKVRIEGGSIGETLMAFDGSDVVITGGVVNDGLYAYDESRIVVAGGEVHDFVNLFGAEMIIAGGSIGEEFNAHAGSEVHLIGTQFSLSGLGTLTPYVPTTITLRDRTLNATLVDGSTVSFYLNDFHANDGDYFAPTATVTVTLVLPGDYDQSGEVDGADFLLWQRQVGSQGTLLTADGNYDGIVDQADLAVWQQHYGTAFDTLQAIRAVPEPAAISLASFAIFGLLTSSRRRDG